MLQSLGLVCHAAAFISQHTAKTLKGWLRIGWYRLCPILPRYTPRVSDHDPREGWVRRWGMERRYETPIYLNHRGGAKLTDLITC